MEEAKSVDDGVIHGISRITRRGCHSIRQSSTTLPNKEIKKSHDLCNNYDKIIRYGKLDDPKEFKLAVELDLRCPLSYKQARHSQACVKSSILY